MTVTTRRTAREIGSDGMLMNYSNPHIIKHQLVALKNLNLLTEAMPSIEAHNPVLAAAIASGRVHYLHYDSMHDEVKDYHYESESGEGFIAQTKTWVAHLHYELQTVALFDLVRNLEAGELKTGSISDYRTALGKTPYSDDGPLAFNSNPARQPRGFFDRVTATMLEEGLRKSQWGNGATTQYFVPDFLWSELNPVERGRLAAKLIRADLNGDFNERALQRSMGELLACIFAWNPDLHEAPIVEDELTCFFYEWREYFAEGRVVFDEDGFVWREELRGMASRRPAN